MIKELYLENIKTILDKGEVEGIKLTQVPFLREIFKDEKLNNILYNRFNYNFDVCEFDDLFMKTQDFIYRLNFAIHNWLIPVHGIEDIDSIKVALEGSIYNGLDLWSSVSYDMNDLNLLDEFESCFSNKDISV